MTAFSLCFDLLLSSQEMIEDINFVHEERQECDADGNAPFGAIQVSGGEDIRNTRHFDDKQLQCHPSKEGNRHHPVLVTEDVNK